MNSEGESHYHAGGKDRSAVGGNRVAARRGEGQPETEGGSRTEVNSIRHVQRVSLRGKGEAAANARAKQGGDASRRVAGRTEGMASLYLKYKATGVKAELHIYAHAGHGFGYRPGSKTAAGA